MDTTLSVIVSPLVKMQPTVCARSTDMDEAEKCAKPSNILQ